MDHFTPISSLAGGILIGLSASAMMALLGRVAGISGIVGGLFSTDLNEVGWRATFVGGLLLGGVVFSAWQPDLFAMTLERSGGALALSGLLIGFGSRLGSGCTSGHGVCGIARGSTRSIVATITFMTTGALVTFLVNQVFGGNL